MICGSMRCFQRSGEGRVSKTSGPRRVEFYSTAETIESCLFDMVSMTDRTRTPEKAEAWLQQCKREALKTGDGDSTYWDRVKILRIVIECEEIPRAANVSPKAPKRHAGGKTDH